MVMPRGWWHTNRQDGEQAAFSVIVWLDTQNSFCESWWRSQQDMGPVHKHAEPARGALQSGMPQGLSREVKYATFERLRQAIAHALLRTYLHTYGFAYCQVHLCLKGSV